MWIAIDKVGGYLYWDEEGVTPRFIVRASLATPTPTVIGTGNPQGMVADTKYVYWTEPTRIAYLAVTSTGTSPGKTLVASVGNATGIATDGKALYWLENSTGVVGKVALPP